MPGSVEALPRNGIRKKNVERILRAAEIVFAECGYKGATIAAIATEAGLPSANIHFYFSTKKALYNAVLSNIFDLWKHAAAGFDQDLHPRQALAEYITLKMELSRSEPLGSKIWATEIIQGGQMISDFLLSEVKPFVESCSRTIRRWIRLGYIPRVDPMTLMFMIWGTTQHYADFQTQIDTLRGQDGFTDRQYKARTREVTNIILNGLGLS